MNSKIITVNDFDKICRICLEEEDLYPIRRTNANDKKVSELLEYTVMMDTTSKILPQHICKICIHNLCNVHEFKKLCEDSEARLKSILENSNPTDEDFKFNITLIDEPLNCDEENVEEDSKSNIILFQVNKSETDYQSQDQGPSTSSKYIPKIKCRLCDYETPNQEELQQHREECHTHLMCEVCSKIIPRNYLKQHMYHHTKPFKCKMCFKGFPSHKDVKRHEICHTEERPHICTFCGKGFRRLENVRNHEKNHHLKNISQDDQSENTDESRDYVCKTCGHECDDRVSFQQHRLSHIDNTFLCNECGKRFVTNAQLQVHFRNHTGEKPYACNTCKKCFATTTLLQAHTRTHSDLRPFKCTLCDKAYKVKSILVDHLKTHTGDKRFGCEYCGKRFVTNSRLTIHIRTHTGERPYVCNVCERGFCDSSHLRKHAQKMHKVETVRKDAKPKKN